MREGNVLTVLQLHDLLHGVEAHHPALQVAGAEGLSERNGRPRHPVRRDGGPECGHTVVEILLGLDHCELDPGSLQVGGQLEAGISTTWSIYVVNILLINPRLSRYFTHQ